MRQKKKRAPARVGVAPGTLQIDASAPRPELSAFAYDATHLVERPLAGAHQIAALRQLGQNLWVHVDGLGDAATLAAVAENFHLHPLAMEDVVNVRQRPKVEVFDDYVFVVLRSVAHGRQSEQVSLFFGAGFVLTFQEARGDCFDHVRGWLRQGDSRVRHRGADFLAYSLIDALIDHYFPLLEASGEAVEALNDRILAGAEHGQVREIHHVKRELLHLRRAIWPLRDELNVLMRQTRFVHAETVTYLRDCYDHTLLLIDNTETLRDITAGLMDLYLSSVNNRMNDVMKTLTVISTIFIPLTFLTGLWGMNFNTEASAANMPELNWPLGYPAALVLMAVVAGGVTAFVWRQGWLRSFSAPPPAQNDSPPGGHTQLD